MKDNGKKINKMAKARKLGLMVLVTPESINKEKSPVTGNLFGLMAQNTTVNSLKITFMEKVRIL